MSIRRDMSGIRMYPAFYKKKGWDLIMKRLYTAESVTEGHPDKLCDLTAFWMSV